VAETFARMRVPVLQAAFVASLSHDVPRDRHDVLVGEGWPAPARGKGRTGFGASL